MKRSDKPHGEPSRCLSANGIGMVQVQTNAVLLAKPGALEGLRPNERLQFFVSLHAVDEDIYDSVTGSRGMLPKALMGLRALLEGGFWVLVNVVATRLNARHLPELVKRIHELFGDVRLPELHVSTLICPPHRPQAAKWLLRYEDLVPELERMATLAEELGVPMSPLLSSTHASIPPCYLPEEQRLRMRNRPLPAAGETGYDDLSRPWVKAARCKSCTADRLCLGVPRAYAQRFGLHGLKPFR